MLPMQVEVLELPASMKSDARRTAIGQCPLTRSLSDRLDDGRRTAMMMSPFGPSLNEGRRAYSRRDPLSGSTGKGVEFEP